MKRILFLFILGTCSYFICAAQKAATQPPVAVAADTSVRIIEILQGNSLRSKTIDSVTTIETIAGKVQLREGNTLFNCDSAIINRFTNTMEAFGNVHINQNDSINAYSQYLKYTTTDRIAHLSKDVKITNKKGILTTQNLDYDLKTNIGNYYNGGKVLNGKTTLTSNEGTYYADTKDVYFKKNVHLVDPKYNIVTDSLLYNTENELVTFITGTHIKSDKTGEVYTTQGTYDLKKGKAFFGNRSIIQDGSGVISTADDMAFEETSGIAELRGNAIIKDTVNHFTLLANHIFSNQKNKSFLATQKPILILVGDGHDSTFIAADTLYSGIVKPIALVVDTAMKIETVRQKPNTSLPIDTAISFINNNNFTKKDSATKNNILVLRDKFTAALDTDTKKDSTQKKQLLKIDTIQKNTVIHLTDTTLLDTNDTAISSLPKNKQPTNANAHSLKKATVINTSTDTTMRYFQAFRHVRIFNDSVQSICDSLYYSAKDSVFRMFTQPAIFSHNTQITGDTIYLYTKNKKADRMYAFFNGMIISKTQEGFFNQIGGRTINGFFKNGSFNYMRVKGNPAQSIFYPRSENDSTYTGMNRCKGDAIDIYFLNDELNKVKFINDVDGTLYPMNQIPEDQKFLKGYKWLEAKRPKNKYELYE